MAYERSDFRLALRPFSLVVALATCSLGISLAALDGYRNPPLAVAVLVAGLLLQAGVNLINDHADLGHERFDAVQRRAIVRNARIGALFIAVACAIGLWLTMLRGWPLLLLGLLGVGGAWSYADGPLNFKARGLGMVAVFFLTGVLMVEGAYFAVSGQMTWSVVWLSIPFSLYASLLLLANEIRDYERDLADGHRTFTVRFGFERGILLYRILVAGLVVTTIGLAVAGEILWLAMPLLALALLLIPMNRLEEPADRRGNLARMTGGCYFAYSALFVVALWIPAL